MRYGRVPIPKLSVEEYLDLDRAAEGPSEFHDGEMFPIEAVTYEHAEIGVKVGGCLERQLRGSRGKITGSPLRVRVSPNKYVIPDFAIIREGAVFTDDHRDSITNPKVMIEVLSPSTADYDYGQNFLLYRRLASFEEYALVSQDEPRMETYRKTSQDRWTLTIYTGLEAVVPLESLGISMALAEVYAGVEFPAAVED